MNEFDPRRAPGPIELFPAGPDAWRAIDSSYPLTDARCLLAYVEAIGDRYVVLSLIPPLGGVTEVDTLAAAETVVWELHLSRGSAPTSSSRRVR
jgi:hypothetical protein